MERSPLFLHSDARILDGIRRGDEGALVKLYHSNRRPVASFVLGNSGTADDAEDMLQEALVILWERVRSGRFEYAARLETFIYATVRRLWLRRLARRRREIPGAADPETTAETDTNPLEAIIEAEEAREVRDALDRLGEPCRTLLILFYWEEASMEEIASRLGFANAETAKSKKYQCKKALEQILRPRD